MKSRVGNWHLIVAFSFLLAGCASSEYAVTSRSMTDEQVAAWIGSRVSQVLTECTKDAGPCGLSLDPGSALDSIKVDRRDRSFTAFLNKAFAQKAFRETDVRKLESRLQAVISTEMEPFSGNLIALGRPIKELVPNFYRQGEKDQTRMPQSESSLRRLTTNLSKPWQNNAQLSGRHIAIWPSHGWYYEYRLDRWEWQRARLFQTVEDIFPMSFVVPYLMPMLEGAGAYVHIPRERDTQAQEVIVDNDTEPIRGNRFLEVGEAAFAWRTSSASGFHFLEPLLDQNPFNEGTYRVSRTDSEPSAMASWIPTIPESGTYSVYVSYGTEPNATSDAKYTIYHTGGVSEFSVDQKMMGGTWVYLGTFDFESGSSPEAGRVDLSNVSAEPGKTISADAVRFGGGMGTVERGGKTSGRPRFTEGARYYLQYAGMPDSLVYNVTEGPDDYIDDYRGRAEWVNYLKGTPFGPNKNRSEIGLNVPVDISLAFHTDAGITKTDRTIGTLMIYSSTGAQSDSNFPYGMSRFANRDLGDIMQTTIVTDLRQKYDSTWTRRAIWDRDYSEAVRPNVPGVLLELLSHQNFADMRFGLDPRFKFDVARSIYKSMANFLAAQNGYSAIIEPLPVTNMKTSWNSEGQIEVTWKAQIDPLEESAVPTGYVIRIRTNDSGYANGIFVTEPRYTLKSPAAGTVYAFRVSAVNAGGEGFAGEEVAAGKPAGNQSSTQVLVIAGFDRVSDPESIKSGDFIGFANFQDEGVPDGRDISFVGSQYDFDANSPWAADDSPGHGASYSTFETQVLVGNTFDYPAVHGRSILNAGYSFATASDESVTEDNTDLSRYGIVDLILGEEKRTVGPGKLVDFEAIPQNLQDRLSGFVQGGGSVIATGAHIATDLGGPGATDSAIAFAREVLHFKWRTDHAAESGAVYGIGDFEQLGSLSFNVDPLGKVYRVESPDALEPQEGAATLFRYSDNNMSAVIGRSGKGGVVVAGFPFETVSNALVRDALMKRFLDYVQ